MAGTVVGWVLLGVGGLLIVIAIVLIIVLLSKKRRIRKLKRAKSQDAFKVVYKVPTANGTTTKSDMLDSRSIHTLRSEPGYRYVAPQPTVLPPVHVAPPSVVMSSSTLPRASSVDHVSVTLPRTGERFVVPAPNGTLPRILLPVNKKYKKTSKAKPLLVYDGPAGSVLSAPAYATSLRSVPAYATSSRSIPAYATNARSVTSGNNNKYYMYGSTPNLASVHHTQPVLMYDGQRRTFGDDLVGGNAHVQNWLSHEQPLSLPGDRDETDFARPTSRLSASSVPDMTSGGLHMKWSPSMRRRLEEMDRRERMEERERNSGAGGSGSHLQQEVSADGKRYTPLHHYTELSEEF